MQVQGQVQAQARAPAGAVLLGRGWIQQPLQAQGAVWEVDGLAMLAVVRGKGTMVA